MTVAIPSRREQNKSDKRARIIKAARRLFTQNGYEATTTQEIADAAGVAGGTIFTYARTKDDLLILVFHDEMLELVEHAYAAARRRRSLLAQLLSFFDTMVVYHERDMTLSHALMRQLGYVASPDQRGLVADLMRRVFDRIAHLVSLAKERGEVGNATPLLPAARAMFAVYYFHLGGRLSGYMEREQFDRALRTDLGLVVEGLSPPLQD